MSQQLLRVYSNRRLSKTAVVVVLGVMALRDVWGLVVRANN